MGVERTCSECGAAVAAGAEHDCKSLRKTSAASPAAISGARQAVAPPAPTSAPAPAGALEPAQLLPAPAELEPPAAGGAVDDEFDPRIGTLLGEHYRILERLGAGGMGTVYLVVHVHLKKKFAAKILNPDTAKRPDALARFQQEAVSASKLDHENIVDIVNFGVSDDGTLYLVMEFLKGETLNQILARGALSVPDTVRVAVPVCRALAAAHGAGIVHRDLKPENVFVTRRSGARHVVKILDFGVSKIKEGALAERRLTQTGDVLGSPLYMSPESSRGDADVDGRADIYAVGVMLFEMLTGRVPFTADNYLQVLYKHIQEPPPAPRSLRPELPPALDEVVLRALAKDPAARYQRMEDLEAALIAAAPGVDLSAPISQAVSPVSTSIDTPIVPGSSSGAHAPAATPIAVPAELSPAHLPARRRRSLRAIGIGFVGTVALLAVGAFYFLSAPAKVTPVNYAARGAGPLPAPEPDPSPPQNPNPPPNSNPTPTSSPPPAEPALLSVESDPAGAEVTLDGRALGQTPLGLHIDADGREHTLKLELAGFRAETRQVLLDRDRAVAVVLKKRDRPRPTPMDIKEGR